MSNRAAKMPYRPGQGRGTDHNLANVQLNHTPTVMQRVFPFLYYL